MVKSGSLMLGILTPVSASSMTGLSVSPNLSKRQVFVFIKLGTYGKELGTIPGAYECLIDVRHWCLKLLRQHFMGVSATL